MESNYLVLLLALLVGCTTVPENRETGQVQQDEVREVSGESITRTVTIEGVVSGFDCAVVDYLCPTTHRGADYTNGLFTDNKGWYFIVNIPQAFLTDHFLNRISVIGTTYNPHTNAIEPEQIYLISDDKATLIYDAGYYILADGTRSLRYGPGVVS